MDNNENNQQDLLHNRYKMLDILRIDGMADRYVKYTVVDTQDNDKTMVVKEMIMPRSSREVRTEMTDRFLNQCKKFMELNHPSLCKLTDCFVERGCMYLVFEHIKGEYLDEILQNYLVKTNAPFSEKQVLEVSFRICEALEYLHKNDILCGNLQPNNIMFSREAGRLVLIDFGISRILIPEPDKAPVYNAGYSPPEQYEGIIEPRTDVFALGVIMHHLLSGIDPKFYNVQFTYPPLRSIREELSREVEALVNKAVQKEPANRFNSVTEFKGALGVVYQGLAKKIMTKTGWTMFRGNPGRTGSQGEPLKGIPRFRWKYKTGKGPITCPCVIGSTVYIAAYESYLYAINADDGSVLWEYKVRGQISSSPAVIDGVLYVGCMDCNLYALDINGICLKWKYKTDGLITSSPLVQKDSVYIGSYDTNMYSIDINGGRMKWKYTTSGAVMSSPVILDNIIYFGSLDSHIYAVDIENGNLVWNYKTDYSISSSPSIYENKVFIGSYDGFIYCLENKTGELMWKLNTGSTITSTPAVADGIVYIGNQGGYLWAIDVEKGQILWQYYSKEPFNNTPTISGGKLYFCSDQTKIFALNAKSGEVLECVDTGLGFSSSPTICDGVLFVGTADGFIYAFK